MKDKNAVALGKKGGKARMKTLTKAQKTELAMKGVGAKKEKKWLKEWEEKSRVLTKLRHEDMTEEEIERENATDPQTQWENNHAYEKENGK